MHKRAAMILVCLSITSSAIAAEGGVRVGYYANDVKKAFVGVEASFPIGALAITPSVDYARVSGADLYLASGDLQFVHRDAATWYWLGAGPTYEYVRFLGFSGHSWEWNANAGFGWRTGALRPYATVRYVKLKDGKTTGLAVGFRFGGQ